MDAIDTGILNELIQDSRLSYAELGRQFGLSRASIKERVEKLHKEGIIEQFTVIVNPDAVGKSVSAFLQVEVEPCCLNEVALALRGEEVVESMYLMTGASTLHLHALVQDMEALERFVLEIVYAKKGIRRVQTDTLLKRYKSKGGGARL